MLWFNLVLCLLVGGASFGLTTLALNGWRWPMGRAAQRRRHQEEFEAMERLVMARIRELGPIQAGTISASKIEPGTITAVKLNLPE